MAVATGHSKASIEAVEGDAGPVPATFAVLLSAVWGFVEHGFAKARAYNQLQQLDDRTLRDIGVHRTEVSSILHHDLRDPSRRPR